MKIFLVLYRQSGEDYEVRAFRVLEHAEAFAKKFLQGFIWNGEWVNDPSFQQLEVYCAEKDLAYIEIEEQVI